MPATSTQVFEEGGPCDGFYIILSGYATVRQSTPDGVLPFKDLRSVGPGEVFGYDEKVVLGGGRVRPYSAVTNCAASVRARVGCSVRLLAWDAACG